MPGPLPSVATESTTATDRVEDTLRELILRGDLVPGARLGEVELAERLGVSRTPVREALSRLGVQGLVDSAPNRGARVATWTLAELEGVFDLRTTLEPRLTALAVPRATADDVEELDRLARATVAVGRPGPEQDLDALVPANRAFHDRIVALAAHPGLAGALGSAIRTPLQRRNFRAYDDAALRRSLAHHVEIVDAFRAGDADWAAAVMTAHIRHARSVMVRAADDSRTTPAEGPTTPAEGDHS